MTVDAERAALLVAAHEELRASLLRVNNASLPERQAAGISAVMVLLKQTDPDLAQSEELSGLYSIGEEFLSRVPVDAFGGNDAPPACEDRNLLLSATAHAMADRLDMKITKARKAVAGWGGSGVSAETLRQWGRKGDRITPEREPKFSAAYDKARGVLDRIPNSAVEGHVEGHVKQLVGRLKTRPRLRAKT